MGTVVGVDVGATSVRGVEVQSGRVLSARKAAAVRLAPGVVKNGIVQDEAAVAAALKELWKKGKFSTKKAAFTISASTGVVARQATVPLQRDPKVMNLVVRAQAKQILPVALDDQHFAYHVLSKRKEAGEDGRNVDMADVMLIAAEKNIVDKLVGAAQEAKIRPVSVDITPFALIRLLAKVASDGDVLDMILHVGHDTIDLIGVAGGQPAFMRTLSEYAGGRITKDIQEQFALTIEDAEQVKLDGSKAIEDGEDSDVVRIINIWVSTLARAARQQIAEASDHYAKPVGRVWLSGGGSRLGGLASRLDAEVDAAQVSLVEPGMWVRKADRLRDALTDSHDLTVALAAGNR